MASERHLQGRILAELTREARVSSPVLRQIRQEFDDGLKVDPGAMGRGYESELSADRDEQRASGSFFTPPYLVDFVVEQTLGPVVAGVELEGILKLRILDPSCGGGAFLLGVLRFLEAHCVQMGATAGSQLREQICCHCLVGIDLDPNAIEVARAALRLAVGTLARIPMQLTVGDALLPETFVGEVDAIVGNPPWGQKGLKLSSEQRARYKKQYTTAVGVWDPFKLFVERCHQLLPSGRRWGLVLPDIILLKNLQVVRDVILEGSEINEIAHCGRAFAHANIDAVAIVGTRSDSVTTRAPDHTLRVWPHLPSSWQEAGTKVPTHRQIQSVFHELPGHVFNLYLHGSALNLYRRLRSLGRLGDTFEMHEGVHTGNSRKALFSTTRSNAMFRKIIVGRKEFEPYRLRWGGMWLNTSKSAIDRSVGAYANLGKAHWHGPNKIVVRRTGDRVMAAYDGDGYYVSNNLFVLQPLQPIKSDGIQASAGTPASTATPVSDMTIEERKAIVALLNSRFMTWYFRAVQPRKGRLFAELKLVHLRDFPMPKKQRWHEVMARLATLSGSASDLGREPVSDEVDALVEYAYEVSSHELDVIRLQTY